MGIEYTPRQIVDQLDKYIIGQKSAKRSVAVALRNRYRRMLLDEQIKDEIEKLKTIHVIQKKSMIKILGTKYLQKWEQNYYPKCER